jgi:hypothetical protein
VGLCFRIGRNRFKRFLFDHPCPKKIVRKTYCGAVRVCYIPPSVSRVRERFT